MDNLTYSGVSGSITDEVAAQFIGYVCAFQAGDEKYIGILKLIHVNSYNARLVFVFAENHSYGVNSALPITLVRYR